MALSTARICSPQGLCSSTKRCVLQNVLEIKFDVDLKVFVHALRGWLQFWPDVCEVGYSRIVLYSFKQRQRQRLRYLPKAHMYTSATLASRLGKIESCVFGIVCCPRRTGSPRDYGRSMGSTSTTTTEQRVLSLLWFAVHNPSDFCDIGFGRFVPSTLVRSLHGLDLFVFRSYGDCSSVFLPCSWSPLWFIPEAVSIQKRGAEPP